MVQSLYFAWRWQYGNNASAYLPTDGQKYTTASDYCMHVSLIYSLDQNTALSLNGKLVWNDLYNFSTTRVKQK